MSDERDHCGHDALQWLMDKWGITMSRQEDGLVVRQINIHADADNITVVNVEYVVIHRKAVKAMLAEEAKELTKPVPTQMPDRPVRQKLRSPEAVWQMGDDQPVMYIDENDGEVLDRRDDDC